MARNDYGWVAATGMGEPGSTSGCQLERCPGLRPTGCRTRRARTIDLLTEAEWEYAARAETETRYWWGDDIGSNNANCRGCGSRWDGKETAPARSFSANEFGLYNVHGNVWEWVADCYDGDAYKTHKNYPAMVGDWQNSCDRVLRGGSWSTFRGSSARPIATGTTPTSELNVSGSVLPGPFSPGG